MVELRPITDAEVPRFIEAVRAGFGRDEPDDNSEAHEAFRACFDLATTLVGIDRDRFVATLASCDLTLTVPGGSMPMAGTTAVTVSPTHRRRGLLTEMMTRHLQTALDRGQPLAGLWASEEVIYGRFGYGPAVGGLGIDLAADSVAVAPAPTGLTVRMVTPDEARSLLPPMHDRRVCAHPGGFRRSEAWWTWRQFSDRPDDRPSSATSRRTVVAERGEQPVGYAVYRQRTEWGASGHDGHVDVVELVHDDDDARRALWHYLTSVDLYRNVHWWNAPIDEPVLIETDRFRSLQTRMIDSLWLRLLDVPTCLTARRYEADGTIALDVADPFFGRGGRFQLAVVDGVASCEPLTAAAGTGSTVAIDIADLGALYLGGRSATTLARAGRIDADQSGVGALDRIFRTLTPPHCGEVF